MMSTTALVIFFFCLLILTVTGLKNLINLEVPKIGVRQSGKIIYFLGLLLSCIMIPAVIIEPCQPEILMIGVSISLIGQVIQYLIDKTHIY